MRQIHELFGDQLRDPDRRFELQLALRIRTLSAGRPSEEGRSSLGSATAVADRG